MEFFFQLSYSEGLSRQTFKWWFVYALSPKWNDKWKINFPTISSAISEKSGNSRGFWNKRSGNFRSVCFRSKNSGIFNHRDDARFCHLLEVLGPSVSKYSLTYTAALNNFSKPQPPRTNCPEDKYSNSSSRILSPLHCFWKKKKKRLWTVEFVKMKICSWL